MKIILGADHGGFELKEKIKAWLGGEGYSVMDVGALALVPDDDYVDFAKMAVKEMIADDDRGILFCRNGFGMSIVANKYVRVRCGLAFDVEAVQRGRTDDDINCLSIPTDYVDEEKVKKMIDVFLKTSFSGDERYVRRVNKIDNIVL